MTFPISITSLDDAGTLLGVAAFDDGLLDRNLRRYAVGAFDKSLAAHRQRGTMPAMLLFHDINRPVGAWQSVEAKGNALHVRGRIERSTADGAEAYALVKAKAIQSLSTGALHEKTEPVRSKDRNAGDRAGELITEADLLEISLVAIPANKNANIIHVNSISGPAAIEEVLKAGGLSGRKAKIAASAAWQAIQTPDERRDDALTTILTSASSKLARFKKD